MVSYRAPLLMTGISTQEMFGVWASVLPSVCLWALTWTRPYSCTLCESAVGPEKDWHLRRGPYAPASALQGNSSMGLQQMRKGYGGACLPVHTQTTGVENVSSQRHPPRDKAGRQPDGPLSSKGKRDPTLFGNLLATPLTPWH